MPCKRRSQPQTGASLLALGLCCGLLLSACGGSKGANTTSPHAASPAPDATPPHTANPAPGTVSTHAKPARGASTTGAGPQATGKTAGSHVVSARVVAVASGALTATMTAAGHRPRVGVPWPVSFVVKDGGKPAKASVEYEYLFGGAVVAHRSHYKFTGRFHDVFNWPASAVGYPLTFRAVVLSAGVTLNLDYPVQVRR